MRFTRAIGACGLVLIGVVIGAVSVGKAQAQLDTCATNGAWDIKSGRSAEGNNWYAVKFNRCTGETWVLAAEGGVNDDKWLLLPAEKAAGAR
jgi:hypothetical protein